MKKYKQFVLPVLVMGLFLVLNACGINDSEKENSTNEKKIKIVTTFYPMYDFTRNIVQDNADISMLIPAGTEPHGFEPSAKNVAAIEEADVFIYNSEEMETWVPSTLEAIDTTNVTIINASTGIELIGKEETEEAHDHDEEAHDHDEEAHDHDEEAHDHDEEAHDHDEEAHDHKVDPHVWLDPVLAQVEVNNILSGLVKVDKDNAIDYKENASDYTNQLINLDEEFKLAFEDAENRTFITQHAAFAYLAKQYNLTQVSISGLSPELEPSPAKLAELSDYVKENNVTYVYFENNASSKIAETMAEEANLKVSVLSPIEGVSQDDQDAGVDYIQVMKNNLESLKKSIQ